jgi:hypothetical protein
MPSFEARRELVLSEEPPSSSSCTETGWKILCRADARIESNVLKEFFL